MYGGAAVTRIGLLVSVGLVLAGGVVFGDQWEDIQRRGILRWGADKEGGGPYVYPHPQDPTRVVGFEVELADLLAQRLGVRAEFCQGQWERLPDLLQRGDIDIVLNGYEWSPVWAERFSTTIPYYIYDLRLLARASDSTLRSWDDLRSGPRRRVAVLGGSAAQAYLEEHFSNQVELVLYEGVTDAMRAVELGTGDVDATLQDGPIVTFYLQQGFPGLRIVGDPVGRGFYTILLRKGETRLLHQLNEAIVSTLRDGSLRKVLERYKLWDDNQRLRALECDAEGNFSPGEPAAAGQVGPEGTQTYQEVRGGRVLWQRTPLLVRAAGVTVLLSVIAMPLAILLGLALALVRLFAPWGFSRLAVLYIEIVRGTPLVLQLYVIFFLLPELGINLDAFWAAILGLAVNYSAYEAEIYRAGIQAIPRGQMEAALSLGMSRWMALRRIIIPQATRIVIPPVTNDFIALFKDTAVCSVITVVELSKEYYIHARSTGAVVELGLMTAILYLAMSYPLGILSHRLEQKLRQGRQA